jgi:hypothetical protein
MLALLQPKCTVCVKKVFFAAHLSACKLLPLVLQQQRQQRLLQTGKQQHSST